jgi:hypothetical protein
VKEIGCVPVHVPGLAVKVCPSCAVPAIVGEDVFDGGVGGGCTTAVAAEVAVPVPLLFLAVTTTRIVEPTSRLVRTYVVAVAPASDEQPEPLALHRCHWYA